MAKLLSYMDFFLPGPGFRMPNDPVERRKVEVCLDIYMKISDLVKEDTAASLRQARTMNKSLASNSSAGLGMQVAACLSLSLLEQSIRNLDEAVEWADKGAQYAAQIQQPGDMPRQLIMAEKRREDAKELQSLAQSAKTLREQLKSTAGSQAVQDPNPGSKPIGTVCQDVHDDNASSDDTSQPFTPPSSGAKPIGLVRQDTHNDGAAASQTPPAPWFGMDSINPFRPHDSPNRSKATTELSSNPYNSPISTRIVGFTAGEHVMQALNDVRSEIEKALSSAIDHLEKEFVLLRQQPSANHVPSDEGRGLCPCWDCYAFRLHSVCEFGLDKIEPWMYEVQWKPEIVDNRMAD